MEQTQTLKEWAEEQATKRTNERMTAAMNDSRIALHGFLEGLIDRAIIEKASAEQQAIVMQARIRELENRCADLECKLEAAYASLAADDRMMEELRDELAVSERNLELR